MNTGYQIDIYNLRWNDSLKAALKTVPTRATGAAGAAGENPFLFKFKELLIGLMKEGFLQVVITNKSENTLDTDPYYQVVINKRYLTIKDLVGESLKRKVVYQWGAIHFLVNGKEEPIHMLKPFLKRLEKDLNDRALEIFYAQK